MLRLLRMWCVLLMLQVPLSGCAALVAMKNSPKDLNPGDVFYVTSDSAILQVMGPGLDPLDHRTRMRGREGAVIPVSASVSFLGPSDPVCASGGSTAPLAKMNPWICVKVTQSPIVSQVGWRGWVHYSTLQSARDGQGPAPQVIERSIARPALLCPDGLGVGTGCRTNLGVGTKVRPIRCENGRVWIELWTERGAYITGYVGASELDVDPCK